MYVPYVMGKFSYVAVLLQSQAYSSKEISLPIEISTN